MTRRALPFTLSVSLAMAGAMGLALVADAARAQDATAKLLSPEGNPVGVASLYNTPAGVLIELELTEAPEGEHGFHIHAVGKCGPDFGAAGGHLGSDDAPHGFLAADGPHAGDLPNIHVPQSGTLKITTLAPLAKLADSDGETPVEKLEDSAQSLFGGRGRTAVLDADGAALMIHQGPDDYATDPAGASGPRIACGVIEAL
ncbi:superoxide dismutase family protein [Albimonas sp. CAU 1670]|uniref:superoxide dismutase family protein n=1 Tax=Albimonas sp. CAU 1670 TaxID=3032599 RepID=UPI0023DC4134|nr:superoxide dismutase family protein [Albimonas sp. CAU 1670]MDF2232897.1 superoxide dismutase family protein [Albimonas sp. CAU 1670]